MVFSCSAQVVADSSATTLEMPDYFMVPDSDIGVLMPFKPAHMYKRHNARAIENGVYVIVSGSGHPGGTVDVNLFNSKIISPIGRLLGAAHDDMEIALAEIDFNEKPIVPGLSVRTGAQPHNIYMNERHPELYEEIYR